MPNLILLLLKVHTLWEKYDSSLLLHMVFAGFEVLQDYGLVAR